jgi:mucin-19
MGLKVFSQSTLRGKTSAESFINAMPNLPSPGVVTSLFGYRITTETFTANGTFIPKFNDRQFLNIEILVVGGGASGGRTVSQSFGDAQCGGGGAGQFIYIPNFRVPISAGTSIPVTIGNGGTNPSVGSQGNAGGNTTFGSLITALGGGGGGCYTGPNAADGGSGGGAGSYYAAYRGSNTSTGGYPGGGNVTGGTTAGGGGGSGGAGRITGGGSGTASSISGSSVTYAAGGNGNSGVVNGAANTGNGGSGSTTGNSANAGAGGSGIVIVRYFEGD